MPPTSDNVAHVKQLQVQLVRLRQRHYRQLPYGMAMIAGGVALVPWFLAGSSAEVSSVLLFLAATMATSWYGGLGPGLTVAGTATLAGLFLFVPAPGSAFTGAMAAFQSVVSCIAAAYISRVRARVIDVQGTMRHQRAFIDAMKQDPGEGICTVDTAGGITFVNGAAQRMLGWTEDQLIEKTAHQILHTCASTYDPHHVCPLQNQPDRDAAVQKWDDLFLRSDATTLPVSCAVAPLRIDRKIVGTVITFRDTSEHVRALEELRESQDRYRMLVETSPDAILLIDRYGFITMANRRAGVLYGYAGEAPLDGQSLLEIVAPADRPLVVQSKREAVDENSIQYLEYMALRRDGTKLPVEGSFSVIVDDHSVPTAFIHVARDITIRKQAEEVLRVSETRVATQQAATNLLAQASALGDAMPRLLETICRNHDWDVGVFWMVERESAVLRCRTFWRKPERADAGFDAVTRQMRLPAGTDFPGHAWQTRSPLWVADVVADSRFSRVLAASKEGLASAVCVPILSRTGVRAVLELFSRESRVADPNMSRMLETLTTQIGQFIDRKDAEKALRHQAMHDALTDLPNRTLLRKRLDRSVSSARTDRSLCALLLMDLDRFKEVNDTFGHHYGDALLQEVSSRLRGVLRDTDTVARLGGDEFAVLLPGMNAPGSVQVAGRIHAAVVQPIIVNQQMLDIATSIGIALFPDHGDDADTLMRHADIAMYAAKRSRSGHMLYVPEQDEYSVDRLTLMAELRKTIERDQLMLYYQPKVDLKTGAVDSVEALLRWHHPTRGMIPPDTFIPMAEQTGLIAAITHWVLNAALHQSRVWHDEGINLRIAVNLSAQSLHERDLPTMIAQLLERHGVKPEWLEIEITESAVMSDSPRAIENLARLHETGVRISIDDFGTGYSSLARLKRLPVDELKIDKSFVLEMTTNDDDAFIARSVIDLGHNLGLDVVAEGVKDAAISSLLLDLGCDVAQGFYHSYPLPASECARWLRHGALDVLEHKQPVDFLKHVGRAGA
ncbi:MAG: hypothetical protein NVS4B2_19880 [Chloroflexota bacterium]